MMGGDTNARPMMSISPWGMVPHVQRAMNVQKRVKHVRACQLASVSGKPSFRLKNILTYANPREELETSATAGARSRAQKRARRILH